MVEDDLFVDPSSVGLGGDFIKLQEFEGRLIVLRAKSGEEKTLMKDGEPVPYIEAELLDVEADDPAWQDLWIFPVVVLGKVKNAYPKPMAGVLGKEAKPSKPGRTPAWTLIDASEKQRKAARAAYVKAEAGF